MLNRSSAPPCVRRAFTVAQVAALLNLPERTVYAYAQRGVIPAIRLAGRVLVPAEALDRLLAVPAVQGDGEERAAE